MAVSFMKKRLYCKTKHFRSLIEIFIIHLTLMLELQWRWVSRCGIWNRVAIPTSIFCLLQTNHENSVWHPRRSYKQATLRGRTHKCLSKFCNETIWPRKSNLTRILSVPDVIWRSSSSWGHLRDDDFGFQFWLSSFFLPTESSFLRFSVAPLSKTFGCLMLCEM